MPSYGSLHSPSLRKMENSRGSYGRKGINMGNIIGDPFALATISIGAVSNNHPQSILLDMNHHLFLVVERVSP